MGFFRRATPPPEHQSTVRAVPSGFHTETVLVADRDTSAEDRLSTLTATIGAGLSGQAGTIVGHDRGGPERSLTGPVPAYGGAAADAMANVIQPPANLRMEQADYQNSLGTDIAADPVKSLLWDRISQ